MGRDINLLSNIIAENIKKFRKESGYSQLQFALKCQISQSYLAEIETSKKSISIKKLEVIAKGLEKPIYLFLMTNEVQVVYDNKMMTEYIKKNLPSKISECTDNFLKLLI